MSTSNPVSVRSLRAHYRQQDKAEQDKHEILGYYVFRPLSFYPTAWFLKLGISANQTTWISIAILVAGCLLLATGEYASVMIGALLVNAWIVLDFVDGNIARYQQTFSAYGEFLDALGASVAYLAFFAAGVGGYLNPDLLGILQSLNALTELDPAIPLIAGAWASLAAIWIRVVYQKFRNTFPGSDFQRYDVVGTGAPASFLGKARIAAHNLLDLSGFILPLLLLSVAVKILGLFLIAVAMANTIIVIIALAQIVRRAAVAADANSPE